MYKKIVLMCRKAMERNLIRLLNIEEHSYNGGIYIQSLCEIREERTR